MKKERKTIMQKRRHKLRDYLEKAGFHIKEEKVIWRIFNLAILVNLIISSYVLYLLSNSYQATWETVGLMLAVIWVFIFVIVMVLLWVLVYTILDLRIYKRRLEIEEVLPDFLQLTASNIKAGMTIDKALWYAVRPRFGVLAKEIEIVAKETMSGVELKESLLKFAEKYDSIIVKRSINMMIEGLEAGGKIGDLLEKIANNIKEQEIMVKEIASSVTTYTIFITFATIVAAPLLFALSGSLIIVIQKLGASLSSTTAATSALVPFSFSSSGISIGHFMIFATVSLTLSSMFSAMIIATIKKGNIKAGLKYVPIFLIVSLSLYFLAVQVSEAVLGLVF